MRAAIYRPVGTYLKLRYIYKPWPFLDSTIKRPKKKGMPIFVDCNVLHLLRLSSSS